MPAQPPAWQQTEDTDPTSWIIALVVLIVGFALVAILSRRPTTAPVLPPTAPPGPGPTSGVQARLTSLEVAGEAMLDAGYSVTGVRAALLDIARVNGDPSTEIVVLPNALFVSSHGGGQLSTGATSSGSTALRLDQVDALDTVIRAARRAPSAPDEIPAGIAAMRALPPPFSPAQRVAAYGLLSAGLSVLLNASWAGVATAAILGLIVGVLLLLAQGVRRQYRALVTVGLSFGVSTAVFSLTQLGFDPGVLPALAAPLITLLPGALLTTGVIELATGQMMAGAGRLAGGTMQLILLAAGVVAGSALVGVPQLDLTQQTQNPIGPLGPWLAVALFGIGIVVYQGGRPRTIGWILLVLYVAYGAQVIGDIFFGGVLSAMVGALAMTPVAYLVSHQRGGPAAFASFLPAFWMLVPGTLGLVGVAGVLGGDSTGVTTLVTTASTMVAITLGILAGTALGSRLSGDRTVVAV